MVIQRSWKSSNSDALLQNSSSEDSSGSWQLAPSNRGVSNRDSQASTNMPNRHVINRQVALNTLAAMHRRFGLPGVIQTNGRPPAEFRASANKSLDILRQTIQAAVTKEIDQVIKKYLEKFFVPAVNNIRSNLGEESVGEEQVRAVCRAMLDGARCLYAAPPRPPARPTASPSELSDSESSNGADSRFGRPSSSPSYGKRKESDTDSDAGIGARRKKRTDGVVCPAHKWDPARLTQDTLFIMGSIANKVLGLGQSRGRLYSKHAGLLRYPADSADKEWIANQNMTTPAGGRTYIMVLEDIQELVASEDYRHSPALQLNELSGFRAPPFMLKKIQAFLSRRGEISEDCTSSTPTPTPPPGESSKSSFIKTELIEDSSDAPVSIKIEEIDDKDIKTIKIEEGIDDHSRILESALLNRTIKVEKGEASFKFDNQKIQQSNTLGNFTSVVASGVSSVDGNYWKNMGANRQSSDSMKVEISSATEFIDADIEFLSSDFCSYNDSEADVKKSFDRLSDGGGGGDIFTVADNSNLLGSVEKIPASTANSVSYIQSNQASVISKPTIISSSVVGNIASGSLASNIMQTYATAQNTSVKTLTLSSNLPSISAAFSSQSFPVSFSQTIHSFPQNSSPSQIQLVSQVPQSTCSNTITLQPNILQPATRTVYSLASTTKSLNNTLGPGSTIIGFANRPNMSGNIINTGNVINISSKNFASGNILHNAIVSRNMVNRGLNRFEMPKPSPSNQSPPTTRVSPATVPCASTFPNRCAVPTPLIVDLNDDASITTTKAMIDNTCNSSAMLKKVLTLGSAGVNKTFLTPPTQKGSSRPSTSSTSSSLSASHATLSALLSSGTDSTHPEKKNN